MAYTTINDPSAYFQTTIYTGNGGSQDIINGGNSDLQPDFLWIKQRSGAPNVSSHVVKDSSRGVTKEIFPNATNSEGTSSLIDAFLSDGFSINNTANEHYNSSGALYVSWQWKANGGTRTTNTESGNNPAGGYQANTTAGFSIVDYVGTGATGTMAHGLGAVPQVIIIKDRSEAAAWIVYHHVNGNGKLLKLNTTDAVATESTVFNDTTPTSSVFTIGSANNTNKNDNNFIAYCFTPIQGYSKFGSYTGNGSADGPFVYTGFKPAWVMTKRTDTTSNWYIYDSTRNGSSGPDSNQVHKILYANDVSAEIDNNTRGIDMTSNGFKIRNTLGNTNASGGSYIYMCFASHPFVSSEGVPVTAR
jgi:hypothetical protein